MCVSVSLYVCVCICVNLQLLPVIEAALNDRIPTSVVFDYLNSFLRLLLKRIHTATTGEMDSGRDVWC